MQPLPPLKILGIAGSLRRASINRAFLKAAIGLAPPSIELTIFDGVGDLPLFNPDLDEVLPVPVRRLHDAIAAADVLLIASPEYAHGVTGVIKNLLDWLVSFEPFVDKPVAVVNLAARARHADAALRETLITMSARIIDEASITIPLADGGRTEDAMAGDPRIAGSIRGLFAAIAVYPRGGAPAAAPVPAIDEAPGRPAPDGRGRADSAGAGQTGIEQWLGQLIAAPVEGRRSGARIVPVMIPACTDIGEGRARRGAGMTGGMTGGMSAGDEVDGFPGAIDAADPGAVGAPRGYLKFGFGRVADEIAAEHARLVWLGARSAAPRVAGFVAGDQSAFLLTRALPGRNGLAAARIDDQAAVVRAMAAALRELHALRADDCPFDESLEVEIARARRHLDAGRVDADDFDKARQGRSAEAVFADLVARRRPVEIVTVTHGDPCLDNLIFDRGRFVGFVDCGRVGRGDRHRDLALAHRSIGTTFGTDLAARFLAEYGEADVDPERLAYYCLLDEFF